MATVTGISDHIGWAELVTLTTRAGVPAILERRRVELVEAGLPSAPYHHEGLQLPLAEVEPIVRRTRASVADHCRRAVQELKSSSGVEAVTIQASPYEALPESVAQVLSDRLLTYAADGMLYREELARQAAALGLAVHRHARKSDPFAQAAGALGIPVAELVERLAGFGRTVGAPWRQEHKQAAAAALSVLAGMESRRPPGRGGRG